MKVSVIVPVYGVEKYIETCARSLMAQTYRDVEFIFVNDGTKDRSMEILSGVIDPERTVKIINKENAGLPQARLTGLQNASGDYILFVDSDDWIEPDMVEQLVKAVSASNADMAYARVINETARGTYISRDPSINNCRQAAKAILYFRMHGYLCNKLIRRSLFTPELFYPTISMHEDLVLSCQALYSGGKCVELDKPLYHYRKTDGASLSQMKKAKRDADSARNFLQLYEFWKGKDGSPIKADIPYIMVRCAWLAWKNDRSIFKEYPYLADMARKVPLSAKLGVKFHRQIILKLVLGRV
ncbi:MAG: glycosyltransferase [Bacteroidales bacterium]|nr:glycosyltransferase [Bacteroidales bacterium]